MVRRGWSYTQAMEYLHTPAPVMRWRQLVRLAEAQAGPPVPDEG